MAKNRARLVPRGFFSNPSGPAAPPGAMSAALNVVIEREGVVQPRRGYTAISGNTASTITKLFEYDGKLIAAHGASGLSYYDGAAWQTYGLINTVQPISTTYKVSFATAKRNLYMTDNTRIVRLSKFTGSVEYSGQLVVPGFDRTNTIATDTAATKGPNWLADGKDVAYRALIFKKDNYGDPIYGPVTGRLIFSNTVGATRSVRVRIYLPRVIQNVTSNAGFYFDGYFIQLYRSSAVAAGTGPSDELQQVYEVAVTSTDVTNGYVDVTDVCPDEFRSGFLYTNMATGGTIAANNDPPPRACDIATWKDRLWAANVFGPQRLTLQILAVLGVGGIQNNDTITIDGVTYTGTTGAVGANQYFLENAGSAGQNIERTAMNLCECINKSASNLRVIAKYASKPSDALTLGQIVIELQYPSQTTFTAYVGAGSKTECWQPVLPSTTPDADFKSEGLDLQNGLCWSKEGQPDAFPIGNVVQVGDENHPIIKIVPLRDRLWVFKSDGVFVVTGDSEASFAVQLWDPTIVAIGRETIVPLANEIYLLSNQGVLSISEAGIQVVSGPIQQTILNFIAVDGGAPGISSIKTGGYAIAYESDHQYLLYIPVYNNPIDLIGRIYCFNIETKCWTYWILSGGRDHGIVRPSEDKLYWAYGLTTQKERKTRSTTDYREALGGAIATQSKFEVECGRDPSLMKQFMEVQALFGAEPSTAVSITCSSERATGTTVSVTNKGSLIRRTFPSMEVARCARLSVDITANVDQTSFELLGVALKFREYGGKVSR